MNREAIETKLSSGVATPAEAQGLTFRSAAEPTASEGGEERSERSVTAQRRRDDRAGHRGQRGGHATKDCG